VIGIEFEFKIRVGFVVVMLVIVVAVVAAVVG
jgi:hypothetical protein